MSNDGQSPIPEIIIPKHPGGRPSNYDPEYCEAVKECGAKGWSRAQIAAYLGTTRQTIITWEERHPEFLDAMTAAKELALAWWEHAGQMGMFMQTFSASAYSLQIRNRFPADYRDAKYLGGDQANPLQVQVQEADAFRSRIAGLAARVGETEGAGEPH